MDKKILAIVYNFVGETVVSILFGLLIGRQLDIWLHTYPLFMILFMMLGMFASLYMLVKRVNKNDGDKNERR
jgi:F0F1-type ATP synthase assembly protein I